MKDPEFAAGFAKEQAKIVEEQAYSLLHEVITLAKEGRDYKAPLAQLRAILPAAPQIRAAIEAAMRA